MSQPVKLSDALVLDARIAAEMQERSIAGQVEFWAKLGQSVEQLLNGRQVFSLRRSSESRPLSEALASVDTTEGKRRVAEVLASRPFPRFEQSPGNPGLLIRIEEDGSQTLGRFVNRVFVAEVKAARSRRSSHPKLNAISEGGRQPVIRKAKLLPVKKREP